MAVINERLLAQMDARLETQRNATGQTIGVRFVEEQRLFRRAPLPFAPEAATFATVTPRALVRLEGARSRGARRRDDRDHRRARRDADCAPTQRFGQRSIDCRHYLSELARKPQAVRQVLPDLLRDLGDPFPAMWDQLHSAHGPREAARHFAKVLGQLETHGAAVVVPACVAALATGTSLLLALTPARRPLDRLGPDAVPASLRTIDIGSGCAADYDAWLSEVAG
jgi:hypothetical protein